MPLHARSTAPKRTCQAKRQKDAAARARVDTLYDAAQQVDKFLASCGLRTATRAVLGKVFCVGSFLSEESSPAWYSATVAVGAMISKWLLALQSSGAGGPPRFSTGGHASGTGAQSTYFGGLT